MDRSPSFPTAPSGAPAGARQRGSASLYGKERGRTALIGQSLTWLCGGALALNLLLVVAILSLLVINGAAYFWPKELIAFSMRDGRQLLGEVWEVEKVPAVLAVPGSGGAAASAALDRLRIKIGNRDVEGLDFVWIDRKDIVKMARPAGAVLLERLEWGNFHGSLQSIRKGDRVLVQGPDATFAAFQRWKPKKEAERAAIEALEKGKIGAVNAEIEKLRLDARQLELQKGLPAAERAVRQAEIETTLAARQKEYEALAARLDGLRQQLLAETLVVSTLGGELKELPLGNVLDALRPNSLGFGQKLSLYVSRVVHFVIDDPRESNTEGGIFPAIFGTVMMVFLMSFAVTPLGVLAALYLREYAKQGFLVRMVRIAVNNLAGVPSIVFGMFGLGFFVYGVGGTIDRIFFPEALPTPTFGTGGILWAALTLALLTVPVVIVAAEEGLAAVPRIVREGSLALGATKFETLWRVVLPAAAPGILTGMILAMARAAGEVAPLMIVGMVKLAPTLPIDGYAPFLHLERKFMHLGFHIYDTGFQSPNIEATTPLVFSTALLLIAVVTIMNLIAIVMRNHLRRKYAGSAV
jgi:phosphate transport system permease protein